MIVCLTKDYIRVLVYQSINGAPPFFAGAAPTNRSIWVVVEDKWYDIGQTLQTRSVDKVTKTISDSSYEELQQLIKNVEPWTK